jgi:hypothetical protein
MDLGFPPEVSRRSLELHLDDGFMNIRDVTIIGSGQRPKHSGFTQFIHTKIPTSILYIIPTRLTSYGGGGGHHASNPPMRPETPPTKTTRTT